MSLVFFYSTFQTPYRRSISSFIILRHLRLTSPLHDLLCAQVPRSTPSFCRSSHSHNDGTSSSLCPSFTVFSSYLLLPTFEQRFFRGHLPFDSPILPPLPHFSISGPPGDLLCLSFHPSLKSSRHLSMTLGQWITGNVEMDKGNEANIYGTVSEG